MINSLNGEVMFEAKDLDERGEVPGPFWLERFNFNPHRVRGDFDFDNNGQPIIKKGVKGGFVDKRGSQVSKRGYFIDAEGNIVNNAGRKKFNKAHTIEGGDLPKLFNYGGRRFDVTDTLGQLDKDDKG